jgi:hypoxanthine phosphoribosyltransferase
LDQGKILTYLDYNRMEAWLLAQVGYVQALNPVCIIGLLRGGSFPAVVLSQATDIPVAFMRYHRVTGQVSWDTMQPLPAHGQRVLLCEDFAGSGFTLLRCKEWLEQRGCAVCVLTLVYDELSRLQPDRAMDMRGQKTIFPWERVTLTEKSQKIYAALAQQTLSEVPQNRVLEQWGYDLDGVFLPDVPADDYCRDLEAALARRHGYSKHAQIPSFKDGSYIISGRILSDYEQTQAWLQREGIAASKIILRDPDHYAVELSYLHKAEAIVRHGVSHFVESCPQQAVGIAKHCPHVRVMQWDINSGQGYWITAYAHTE